MTNRPARVSKVELKRLLAAAQDAAGDGKVVEVVTPAGVIRILPATQGAGADSDLDTWRAKKRADKGRSGHAGGAA